MNQVRKSAIQNISKNSEEFAVIKGLCRQDFYWENESSTKAGTVLFGLSICQIDHNFKILNIF